jgi:hypothetical protein
MLTARASCRAGKQGSQCIRRALGALGQRGGACYNPDPLITTFFQDRSTLSEVYYMLNKIITRSKNPFECVVQKEVG